jgi:hypothetical protein
MLDDLGLSEWKESLIPVLNEFVEAKKGNVNLNFWKDIYKDSKVYNEFYVSGWIIKFFPYNKFKVFADEKGFMSDEGTRYEWVYKKNEFLKDNDFYFSTLSTDNFPTGISQIDITWKDDLNDTIIPIEIYAGFFGISQNKGKSLEPVIGWAGCYKSNELPENQSFDQDYVEQEHPNKFWSTKIIKEITDSAIYNPKVNATQTEGF